MAETPTAELINLDDIFKRFDSSDSLLQDIRDTLQASYRRRTIVRLSADNAISTKSVTLNTRLFVDHLIIAVDTTATYTLVIGTNRYPIRCSNMTTTYVPLPILIDRGTTFYITSEPVLANVDAYFVGVVE